MSKKVKSDEKGQNWWKMKQNNVFWIFSGKYGQMSKKVKNDEEGSDIHEKGQMWWKMKKNDIFDFSGKYGKISKKRTNDEKGSDINGKGQMGWKMKKIMFFGFFQENMDKCRKNWKIMKKPSEWHPIKHKQLCK